MYVYKCVFVVCVYMCVCLLLLPHAPLSVRVCLSVLTCYWPCQRTESPSRVTTLKFSRPFDTGERVRTRTHHIDFFHAHTHTRTERQTKACIQAHTRAHTHTHIYSHSLSLSLSLCRRPSTGAILNVCTDVCVCVCACAHSATLYWQTGRSISCMPMGPWTAPAQPTMAASRYAPHAPLNPNAHSNRQTHSEIKREGGKHAYTYTHAHT
jgi:hypothetical protein